jgi:EmrB/QacA subfamily drug resistance transporter
LIKAVNATSQRSFRQNLLAMLGLCFVLIMVALDQTVVGTALPTIVSELKGFEWYAWVGTSYLLTSVIVVPIFGKLGDEHGRKRFVVIAIIIFTLASSLCGISQTMLQLVLSRALQGIGGGILMATSFACIPDLFPNTHERLRWQILFSTAFGLANAFGPSLGGYLSEYWGWRWVFFVNLPVGIFSLLFVFYFLPNMRHSAQTASRMDWFGAFLIALTLGCLQLFVEWLPQNKAPLLLLIVGLLGAISAATLIWWERRCDNPILPFEMFKNKVIGPILMLSLIMGFCLFAIMYYAPLLFQGGFKLSPNQAGMLITPLAVFITIGSIINGRIVTRLKSPKVILYSGIVFFMLSALTMTQTTANTPHTMVATAMALGGLGIGLLLPNLTLIIQACALRRQLGVATAMLQSTRMVGSMLGAAVIGSLISNQYALKVNNMLAENHATQLAHWLDNPEILFSHGLGKELTLYLGRAQHALVEAIHESQWLIVAIVMTAFWLVHRIPPVNINSRQDE